LKSTIQSLDVSYLLHATEDIQKVNSAVTKLVGAAAPPEIEEMTGHFGNSIRRVSFHLHGIEAMKSFQGFMERLPQGLRAELAMNVGKNLDEHSSLFLRFDKQRLVQGDVVMGANDAIRIKVKPRAYLMKGGANEFFATLLTGS
jgi:RNA binding exosome subunit